MIQKEFVQQTCGTPKKGKSIPCALLIIVMWIIFLPLIIVFAVSFILWYVASACLTHLYMCGRPESGRHR